ncbi:homoserine kinase [Nocardioides jishulii]|uniref:Homoserine kinase n=1 Tax=Nocardioides jishulii TaxID=2575440 RepID=A0A4U2YI60_9ACTN|nr:homoserine kinase [Nocardioides jishulii]QCX28055.1 homoserine kinase [Nocardioides jishulii]TKI60719.1 homoserine kinase [Nocardioides jishulii]
MATFVEGPVRVTVPATSANLGPGFDALGLALGTRDELVAEVTSGGIEVDVRGQGAADVPRDESHLVVRAMRMGFRAMGSEPPGFSLVCKNVIPHTRGMGSSSAAIVGGLVLARAMVAGGQLLLDDDAIFRLAAGLEGHPDNVAPAMYGGFTIAGHDGERWFSVKVPVDPRVTTVAFVPTEPVATKVARGLLPATVPHAEAAANAGRAALLVAALTSRPEWLLTATEDKLHQDYREPAMPDSLVLVRELRAAGVPAVVSGAGPTVLALTDVSSVPALLERCPQGWTARHLPVDSHGARVE